MLHGIAPTIHRLTGSLSTASQTRPASSTESAALMLLQVAVTASAATPTATLRLIAGSYSRKYHKHRAAATSQISTPRVQWSGYGQYPL